MPLLQVLCLLLPLLLYTTTCVAFPQATEAMQAPVTTSPVPTIFSNNDPLMPLRRNYGLFDRPAPQGSLH